MPNMFLMQSRSYNNTLAIFITGHWDD